MKTHRTLTAIHDVDAENGPFPVARPNIGAGLNLCGPSAAYYLARLSESERLLVDRMESIAAELADAPAREKARVVQLRREAVERPLAEIGWIRPKSSQRALAATVQKQADGQRAA